MERLLCVKIASRGDLLLCGPAFRRLRALYPDSSLELLVGKSCLDVAEHMPFFNRIHVLDDSKLMAGSACDKILAATEMHDVFASRGNEPFDKVFIFHRDWRYALLARMAGIRVRCGFSNSIAKLFLTDSYMAGEREHHVSQYLAMVSGESSAQSLDGVWQFSPTEFQELPSVLVNHGVLKTDKPLVGLGFAGGRNVKTQTTLKSWMFDRYRTLAGKLSAAAYEVVWLGDREDGKLLVGTIPGINLCGRLSVAETAAVISKCSAVVANDTLLMHLSEALGIPTLGIFGPTDPFHYRPLGPRSLALWEGNDLPCSPCHRDGYFPDCDRNHECMSRITVDMVFDHVMKLLNSNLVVK